MNANPHIPDYWSPEQALAVYELLDALREQVWQRYGEQITEQMRRQYAEQQARAQLELPLNDENPFLTRRRRTLSTDPPGPSARARC